MNTTRFSVSEGKQLAVSKLLKNGVPKADAIVIASHLLRAECRGYRAHGLRRLPAIVQAVKSVRTPGVRMLHPMLGGFCFLDGAQTTGIASVHELLMHASEQAKRSGAVVATASNYVGTTGSLGIYGAELAERGFISILTCSTAYAVAPHGTASAILGTNPIAICVPTHNYPFVADLSTAAWSYGALREAMLAQKQVPLGVVQTINGQPSTDPNDADNGSQLPMAGHKGYALGLAVELLCGPLLGGKAGKEAVAGSNGFFAVVIKSDVVREFDAVAQDVKKLFAEIEQAPLAAKSEGVRIPGKKASDLEKQCNEVNVANDLVTLISEL